MHIDDPLNVGVLSLRQLRRKGLTDSEIRKAVSQGHLTRIIRGFYALPGYNPAVVTALRIGGRVGCLTGCQLHRIWTPPHSGTHVSIPPDAARPQLRNIIPHRTARMPPIPVMPLWECLSDVARHHSLETALIVLESAFNLGKVSQHNISEQLKVSQRKLSRILLHISPTSQSGSETRVRLFIQHLRIRVTPQAYIPEVGYVDMLVGRSLIIECDSQTHHSKGIDNDRDRRRDMNARLQGYQTLRLSYPQIWSTWQSTQIQLRQLFASKDYLRFPRVT